MKSKSKKEITDWAYEQFDTHGVRKPETYTAEELKYLTPDVLPDFIDEHVRKRNGRRTNRPHGK